MKAESHKWGTLFEDFLKTATVEPIDNETEIAYQLSVARNIHSRGAFRALEFQE